MQILREGTSHHISLYRVQNLGSVVILERLIAVSLNLLQESINQSLLNLLSYPWIEDRVKKELVSIHGGYYDFSNCSFEKWTLDFKEFNGKEGKNNYVVKEKELWF